MLCFVFVLGFSGCSIMKEFLGEEEPGEEKPGGEGGGGGTEAGSVWKGEPINGASSQLNIKFKFGVSEDVTGTDGVEAAFQELHAFIQAGGLASKPNVIKLGDYIDLEGGLQVAPSAPVNSLNDAQRGAISLPALSGQSANPKLRLIVVGINSFTKNGNNTPHVVFQFADFPGTHWMNWRAEAADNLWTSNYNAGGYAASEMYPYVKGNFFTGLKSAGVPEDVLWPPTRTVSTNNTTGAGPLTDLLWLPTEREMVGEEVQNNAAQGETAENQARLEYYTTPASRTKSGAYWLASTIYSSSTNFSYVASNGATGGSISSASLGIAPAFCVQ